ncbi:MAG TPA: hypothetical protein VJK50_03865 [Patescibacteria group bacterium]|nr:hypothetical protein [Patescibacteria group bacterium]
MKKRVVLATRIWQRGAGVDNEIFNWSKFDEVHAKPIRHLLRQEVVSGIVVAVNGEVGNPMAELQDKNKMTPTMLAFAGAFPDEIKQGKLIVRLCEQWGPNPGSASALNLGAQVAREEFEARWVMNWSPEFKLNVFKIFHALHFAESTGRSVVGVLRQYWWQKTQWNVPQNTACLWDLAMLLGVNGFSEQCNGIAEDTIPTFVPQLGEMVDAPVAGMEDYHAMLRMMEADPNDDDPKFKWGMIGVEDPSEWVVAHDDPKAMRDHYIKMARQEKVMEVWAQRVFPKCPTHETLELFFRRSRQD